MVELAVAVKIAAGHELKHKAAMSSRFESRTLCSFAPLGNWQQTTVIMVIFYTRFFCFPLLLCLWSCAGDAILNIQYIYSIS